MRNVLNVLISGGTPVRERKQRCPLPHMKPYWCRVSALVQHDELTGLYTVSNAHTALLRWVRTGRTVGDKIEILSGLGADEPFIISAAGRLYNGRCGKRTISKNKPISIYTMQEGDIGKIARAFIQSKLTILLMIAFLLIGGYSTMLIPREEEPQIPGTDGRYIRGLSRCGPLR